MSFAHLPMWGVGAGLAALAGSLFVLQMLRVRHRQLEVPTTMFWREAVEESRARVLRQRFRHPWAYLLFLLIAGLLWLAIAGLQRSTSSDQDYLLILDGSVGMSHPGRFELATELLLNDAANLPSANREVWWSGGEVQLLLATGEHALLLGERLKALQPEAAGSAVSTRLLDMAQGVDRSRPLQVRVYGDTPLSSAALELLPANFEVLRCTPLATARPGNAGFVAAGIRAAQSGRWDRVDLMVEIYASEAPPTITTVGAPLTTNSTGAPLSSSAVPTDTANGHQWRFFDLPARGQRLRLQLAQADAYPADDQVEMVLPQRRPLQVLISASLADIYAPLVQADSALVLADGNPDMVIRRKGEALGMGLPALEIATAAASQHAFEVTSSASADPQQLLAAIQEDLGFAEVDGLALAQQLQQPISLGVVVGEPRRVQIWEELLDPDGGFASSRSFPLFMGRSLRWLANSPPFESFAQSGQPLTTADGNWTTPAQQIAVTAGLPLRPGVAGLYQNQHGHVMAVHAFDAAASDALASIADASAGEAVQSSSMPLWSWLVLLALLLLGVEWMLFHNGRIP